MFADDVATFSDALIALQRQIDIIDQLCTSTHMNLHLDKSKVGVFRNGGILKQTEQWYYKENKWRLYLSINIWVFISLLHFHGLKH